MLEIAALAPARPPPPVPARPPPPPAAAAEQAPPARAAPDGGGGLSVDQLVPLLCKALKLSKPRSKQPTIGGGLHRSTVYQRRQNCGPMTDIWMENCGLATNVSDPARIVAAVVDPKVIKAAGLLVTVVSVVRVRATAAGPQPGGGSTPSPGRRNRRAAAAERRADADSGPRSPAGRRAAIAVNA